MHLEEHISEIFIPVLLKSGTESHGNLKNIDQEFYCLDYYDVSFNKYAVKCRTSLRFSESNRSINQINPYGWF